MHRWNRQIYNGTHKHLMYVRCQQHEIAQCDTNGGSAYIIEQRDRRIEDKTYAAQPWVRHRDDDAAADAEACCFGEEPNVVRGFRNCRCIPDKGSNLTFRQRSSRVNLDV